MLFFLRSTIALYVCDRFYPCRNVSVTDDYKYIPCDVGKFCPFIFNVLEPNMTIINNTSNTAAVTTEARTHYPSGAP